MAGMLKLFFDGGCRPNPGPMETAVVARGILYVRDAVGIGSNSDAEWLALLHALDVAAELGARDVVLVGDALNVVRQAREGIGPFAERVAAASAQFDRVRIHHVRRSHNLAGIALERRRSIQPDQ